MSNHTSWIKRNLQIGIVLLVIGVLVGAAGLLLPVFAGELSFNPRLITGVGILLLGLGIANLVKYGAAIKDAQAARRLRQEERDERVQMIRARAGNRAYLVSAALGYIALMWVSFAESGSLPPVTMDALWWYLVALVLMPIVVYVGSSVYDEKHM